MRTIGVISTYLSGSFLGEVYLHLFREARQRDCRIVAIRAGAFQQGYRELLATEVCDAWIVMTRAPHPDLVAYLVGRGFPVCSIAEDLGVPGCGRVRSDNAAGIRLAMAALYSAGHREFAFVGNTASSDIAERRDAFLQFLEVHQLPREPARVVVAGDFGLSGGWSAAQAVAESGLPVTALLAGNDQNAAGALQFHQGEGRQAGREVCIVGYDNAPLASEPRFQLTTLDQQHGVLAAAALADVLARLDDPSRAPADLRIGPRLIFRASFPGTVAPAAPLAEEPPGAPGEEIWSSSELNRYFYVEGTDPRPLLHRFRQFGRTLELATVAARGLHFLDRPVTEPVRAQDFGRDLLNRTAGGSDIVAIYPLFTDGTVDSVLLASFPWKGTLQRRNHTLDVAELELTAFALERNSAKQRLESQLRAKTEELQLVRQNLVTHAQRSVTGHLVARMAHHLNTPLGALQSAAGNLSFLVPKFLERLVGFQDEGSAAQQLFDRLLATSVDRGTPLFGVNRQAIHRELRLTLEAWGHKNVEHLADILTELSVTTLDPDWEPWLALPEVADVLEAALTYRSILSSAGVVQVATNRAADYTKALQLTAALGGEDDSLLSFNLSALVDTLIPLIRGSWPSVTLDVRRLDSECWLVGRPGTTVQLLSALWFPRVESLDPKARFEVELRKEPDHVELEVLAFQQVTPEALAQVSSLLSGMGGALTSVVHDEVTSLTLAFASDGTG